MDKAELNNCNRDRLLTELVEIEVTSSHPLVHLLNQDLYHLTHKVKYRPAMKCSFRLMCRQELLLHGLINREWGRSIYLI